MVTTIHARIFRHSYSQGHEIKHSVSHQSRRTERESSLPRRMDRESSLPATTCSRGHTHPPWNTSGVLRIAKCESVCGFCMKETDTAAKLRKHVAIHIKNEGLNLTIAEAASGRGRLEAPTHKYSYDTSGCSSHGHITPLEDEHPQLTYSSHTPTYSTYSSASLTPSPSTYKSIAQRPPATSSSSYDTYASHRSPSYSAAPSPSSTTALSNYRSLAQGSTHARTDPFSSLRSHALRTKFEWTVITPSEGFAILDYCKSMSQASSEQVPCYNRETLFDEEWQSHMRDIHGVYLIWPETWMKRVEVLDLEGVGGRIEGVNDLVMEGKTVESFSLFGDE
ncbi:45d2517d-ab71-480c-88e9-289a4eab1bf9 [Sclerotinia trifoliorum]|uniref:45d2517d-ab71-480c-88e9-289a4eab1bf9 n=1 Tax=Sclerotinia trifoliorum TaxID=28548 RepID=A0A8H2VSA1_9HELO|nr:45d2517d-ab71-480c-88e9-289a4eab1bf9 [Sclerotinia trifoliorum]